MKKIGLIFCALFFASCSTMKTSDSLEEKYSDDELVTIERQEAMSEKTYNPTQTVSVSYDSYIFFLFPSLNWLKGNDNKKYQMNCMTDSNL